MKLKNEICDDGRLFFNLCIICDEESYGRIDATEASCGYNFNRPFYCKYCLDNWISEDNNKLQIGKKEPYDGI